MARASGPGREDMQDTWWNEFLASIKQEPMDDEDDSEADPDFQEPQRDETMGAEENSSDSDNEEEEEDAKLQERYLSEEEASESDSESDESISGAARFDYDPVKAAWTLFREMLQDRLIQEEESNGEDDQQAAELSAEDVRVFQKLKMYIQRECKGQMREIRSEAARFKSKLRSIRSSLMRM